VSGGPRPICRDWLIHLIGTASIYFWIWDEETGKKNVQIFFCWHEQIGKKKIQFFSDKQFCFSNFFMSIEKEICLKKNIQICYIFFKTDFFSDWHEEIGKKEVSRGQFISTCKICLMKTNLFSFCMLLPAKKIIAFFQIFLLFSATNQVVFVKQIGKNKSEKN